MIYNKFINCTTLANFNSALESGDITSQHIVFIQETKQIWTMGTFYSTSNLDQSTLEKLESISSIITTTGDGNSYLSNDGTYKEIDEAGYFFIPWSLIDLSNESTSEEIVDALGGEGKFEEIYSQVNEGKQIALFNNENNSCISLNSFTTDLTSVGNEEDLTESEGGVSSHLCARYI